MNINNLLNEFNRMTVGFDHLIETVLYCNSIPEKEKVYSQGGYPPFNLLKNGNEYIIEIAVAGFEKDDLEITVRPGPTSTCKRLFVQTINDKDDTFGEFIHKGIAGRSFSKDFIISNSINIKEAKIQKGILKIYLEDVQPPAQEAQKIPITNGSVKSEPQQLLNEAN